MVVSGDVLFFSLIILGGFLTLFASKRSNILLAFCASLVWFSIALLMWFSTTPIFGLAENWSKLLVWVFAMLTFTPFLFQMDTEIKNDRPGVSWTEWGDKPKAKQINSAEQYQSELRKRLARARRR